MGLVGYTDSSGAPVQVEQQYGSRGYPGKMGLLDHLTATDLVPVVAKAVNHAENNKRNHGVRSVKTKNSAEASKVLNDSVYNNFVRWTQAGKPGKFIDFMQRRWAPIGAPNDPDNLNKNWAPNVRDSLHKDPAVDYEVLQANNIAMNQSPLGAFSA